MVLRAIIDKLLQKRCCEFPHSTADILPAQRTLPEPLKRIKLNSYTMIISAGNKILQ